MSDDLVKQICSAWIAEGRSNECFWEGWPECPTPDDDLTPKMVLERIEKLEAKIERIYQAWADAIYADLDHGMASLSGKTVAEFHQRYPNVAGFSSALLDILTEGETDD